MSQYQKYSRIGEGERVFPAPGVHDAGEVL